VLAVGRHPHDESGPRVVAVAKSNLGQDFTKVRSLSFILETATVTEGDVDVSVGRVQWGDEIEITADELANTAPQTADENSETAQHARRILELVGEAGDDGAPADAVRKTLESEGCPKASFFRSVKRARVERDYSGYPRRAFYRLPQGKQNQASNASSPARARDSAITDTTDTTDTAGKGSQLSQQSQSFHVRDGETTGDSDGPMMAGDGFTLGSRLCSRCRTLGRVRPVDNLCVECVAADAARVESAPSLNLEPAFVPPSASQPRAKDGFTLSRLTCRAGGHVGRLNDAGWCKACASTEVQVSTAEPVA